MKKGFAKVGRRGLMSLALATMPIAWQRGALAATRTWLDGSSNWSTPGNWTGGAVPGAFDTVDITNTDGVNRTITYDYTGAAVTLSALNIDLTGGSGSAADTLSMSANNLSSGGETVGVNGSGVVVQSGGTNAVGNAFYMATGGASTGTYSLSGTGSLSASYEVIGSGGTGNFNQSGGTNTINPTFGELDIAAAGSGTYTLSGGDIRRHGSAYVGGSSSGAAARDY